MVGAYNSLVFILVPSLLSYALSGVSPSGAFLVPSYVYGFGAAITVLQVLGTLAAGLPPSVIFTSGGYIVAAYYLLVILDSGTLSFAYAGVSIAVAFQPVLFLLMVPLLFSALKEPILYLLERTEVALPSPDEV